MIDFTGCPVNKFKGYGGANGNKINIEYNGVSYMLKFPPVPSKNKAMSYTNSCISEYLACHIFESLGFTVQETLLGTYTDKRGKEKIVVACRDFTAGGKRLMEFAHLKNTCVDSEQSGYGTELSSILKAIEEQSLVEPQKLKDFFWDMFVADVWMEEHQYHALADRLEDDSAMEKVVEEIMQKLYEKCVPAEERERIEKIIVQKEVRRKSEEAASRRFVFIEAKKNGVTSCRIGEGYGTPLEVAHACALHYSQAKKMSGQEFLEAAYKEMEAIAKKEFEERYAVDGGRLL